MTNQRVFQYVGGRLLAQNAKSIGKRGGFAYRGENGCRCPVGWLIPDTLYRPFMEGVGVKSQMIGITLLQALGFVDVGLFDILEELQHMHDHVDVKDWPAALAEISNHYKLGFSGRPA